MSFADYFLFVVRLSFSIPSCPQFKTDFEPHRRHSEYAILNFIIFFFLEQVADILSAARSNLTGGNY